MNSDPSSADPAFALAERQSSRTASAPEPTVALGAAEHPRDRIGDLLDGTWRLDAVLGVGTSAAVYAATHQDGSRAAVKLLHPEYAFLDKVRFRLDREAHVADAIQHPGAVRIFDNGMSDEGALFLVMELLDGETLASYLSRRGGRLDPLRALHITQQLLDVVAAAHDKRILHRDIKLDNVFITVDQVVKLLDFGVARLRSGGSWFRTEPGTLLGTPAFMAPEQALGLDDEVDERSDVWSVGATLFRMLTGLNVHFHATTLEEDIIHAATHSAPALLSVMPEAFLGLSQVVDRALAFDKSARWPTAGSMREAVLHLLKPGVNRPPPAG